MPPTRVTNEVQSEVALFGIETVSGTAVTPNGRLDGTWEASRSRALKRSEKATGSYDRMTGIEREAETFSGSYAEDPSYESLPTLLRLGVAGGDTPTSDGNATPGYTRVQVPAANTDNIDTMTIVSGVEGMPWQAAGVRWDEWTLSWNAYDTDQSWKFSGVPVMRSYGRMPGVFEGVATGGTATSITMTSAGQTVDKWVGAWIFINYGTHIGPARLVTSNTATQWDWAGNVSPTPTAGTKFIVIPQLPIIAASSRETIKGDTLDVYIDQWKADGTAIGTTLVSERVTAFSLTQSLNLEIKRSASGTLPYYGRGSRWYTGSVKFHFDHWDEYKEWDEDSHISLRFAKKGSIIDSVAGTRNKAQLDIEKAGWDVFTPDSEGHNRTVTVSFVAENPIGSPNPVFKATTVNKLAVLV